MWPYWLWTRIQCYKRPFPCAVKHLEEPFFELLCLPHFTSFFFARAFTNILRNSGEAFFFLFFCDLTKKENKRWKNVIENTLKKLIYVNFFGYFVCLPHFGIKLGSGCILTCYMLRVFWATLNLCISSFYFHIFVQNPLFFLNSYFCNSLRRRIRFQIFLFKLCKRRRIS